MHLQIQISWAYNMRPLIFRFLSEEKKNCQTRQVLVNYWVIERCIRLSSAGIIGE